MSKTTPLKPPSFAALVQQFFTEHLVAQRAVSAQTVAWYRDALLLFLDFASRKLGKVPTAMLLADVRPDLILAFLDHVEHGRHNAVRSSCETRRTRDPIGTIQSDRLAFALPSDAVTMRRLR
jgi:hypothetical protein